VRNDFVRAHGPGLLVRFGTIRQPHSSCRGSTAHSRGRPLDREIRSLKVNVAREPNLEINNEIIIVLEFSPNDLVRAVELLAHFPAAAPVERSNADRIESLIKSESWVRIDVQILPSPLATRWIETNLPFRQVQLRRAKVENSVGSYPLLPKPSFELMHVARSL
jgi:hypothetical protein